MIDLAVPPAFLGVILLFLIPPGPGMAYMTAVGLQGGRRAAVKAILGVGTGMSVYAAAAAVVIGVGELICSLLVVLAGLKLLERVPWRIFSRLSGRSSSRVAQTRAYVRDCQVATGRRTYVDLVLSGFATIHPAPASTEPTLLMRGEHDMPAALDAIFTDLERAGSTISRAAEHSTIRPCDR